MDKEHVTPKKVVLLAAHGDGEPPKTLDAGYVEHIKNCFDNPENSPFILIIVTPNMRSYPKGTRRSQQG